MSCYRCGSRMCSGTCGSQYSMGQNVEVTFRGVITKAEDGRLFIGASVPGNLHRVYLDGTTVRVLDPEGFPVQVGDVWATTYNGTLTEWFGRRTLAENGPLRMVSDNGVLITTSELKDKNPVLIRRRGQ